MKFRNRKGPKNILLGYKIGHNDNYAKAQKPRSAMHRYRDEVYGAMKQPGAEQRAYFIDQYYKNAPNFKQVSGFEMNTRSFNNTARSAHSAKRTVNRLGFNPTGYPPPKPIVPTPNDNVRTNDRMDIDNDLRDATRARQPNFSEQQVPPQAPGESAISRRERLLRGRREARRQSAPEPSNQRTAPNMQAMQAGRALDFGHERAHVNGNQDAQASFKGRADAGNEMRKAIITGEQAQFALGASAVKKSARTASRSAAVAAPKVTGSSNAPQNVFDYQSAANTSVVTPPALNPYVAGVPSVTHTSQQMTAAAAPSYESKADDDEEIEHTIGNRYIKKNFDFQNIAKDKKSSLVRNQKDKKDNLVQSLRKIQVNRDKALETQRKLREEYDKLKNELLEKQRSLRKNKGDMSDEERTNKKLMVSELKAEVHDVQLNLEESNEMVARMTGAFEQVKKRISKNEGEKTKVGERHSITTKKERNVKIKSKLRATQNTRFAGEDPTRSRGKKEDKPQLKDDTPKDDSLNKRLEEMRRLQELKKQKEIQLKLAESRKRAEEVNEKAATRKRLAEKKRRGTDPVKQGEAIDITDPKQKRTLKSLGLEAEEARQKNLKTLTQRLKTVQTKQQFLDFATEQQIKMTNQQIELKRQLKNFRNENKEAESSNQRFIAEQMKRNAVVAHKLLHVLPRIRRSTRDADHDELYTQRNNLQNMLDEGIPDVNVEAVVRDNLEAVKINLRWITALKEERRNRRRGQK